MAAILTLRRGTENISIADGELYLHQGSGSIQFGSGSNNSITLLPLNVPVAGDINLLGSISASGDVRIGGNIYLGNATADNIQALGQFTSNLVPNGTIDVGTSIAPWTNVYSTNVYGNVKAYNGVISGSSQVVASLPSGIVSGSSQINFTQLAGISANILSASTDSNNIDFIISGGSITANLKGGVVSGSSQIEAVLTSLNSFSASQITKNSTLQTYTASIDTKFTTLQTYTASIDTKFTTLQSVTSSNANRLSRLEESTASLNTFTSSNDNVSLNSYTASLKSAIGLSGTDVTINGNLTVAGTTTQINSTQVNIGDNIIELNFGGSSTTAGIYTKDATGTSTTSGSLIWDSANGADYWKAGKLGSEAKILTDGLGVISGSGQLGNYETTGRGIVSGSSQITPLLPTGVVSGSSQVTLLLPNGVVSGSAQMVGILSSLNSYTSSNDTLNILQTTRIDQLAAGTASVNLFSASALGHISDINTKTGSFETKFSTLQTYTASIDNKFTTIQGVTASFNTATASLNTFSASVNGHISDINVWTASVNTKFTTLQSVTASLNSATASLFISASQLTASFTQLRSDFATLQTSVDPNSISGHIANINAWSSSVNSVTASINTFSASVLGHISDINTKTGSFEAKFTIIQGVTASFNTATASLNAYTQSNDTTNTNQNTRLTRIEESTSSLNTFTASLSTTYEGRASASKTIFSGSSQVSYVGLSNIPAGIISSSAQIDSLFNIDGLISGSSQINFTGLTGISANIISASTNTTSIIHTISGGSISSYAAGGIISGSSQITPLLPAGVVSGSIQVLGSSTVLSGSNQTYVSTINQSLGTTSTAVQFATLGVGTAPDATYEFKVAGDIAASGDIVAYNSSDKRLKNNIQPIENALDKVNQLGGYEFDWNEELQKARKGHDIGVIAQEVQSIVPEVVVERESGFLAVDYEKLVPVLIEAIKELSAKVDRLENK